MKVLLLYLPVPHKGYKELFLRHNDVDAIYLFGQQIIESFDHLRKNLPALSPDEVCAGLNAMDWTSLEVKIADFSTLQELNQHAATIIIPYEDVSVSIVDSFLSDCTIEYDKYFLRYDKLRTTAPVDVLPDCTISVKAFDKEIMEFLERDRFNSSDFWRQVSAAIVIDGQIICSVYNQHLPDQSGPYFYGDPRFNFKRGLAIELSTAEHAEAYLVGLCANQGVALEGATMYVTTFPCPVCAKLIARAGFKNCCFREGYSVVDAESVLRDANVKLTLVK